MRLFKQVVSGDIRQLPFEKNTTDRTKFYGRSAIWRWKNYTYMSKNGVFAPHRVKNGPKSAKMYHTGVKLDFVENIFAGKNITEFDLTPSQSQCQGQQQMCMFVVVCCLISSTIRKIKQPLLKTYILFHITQTLLTSQWLYKSCSNFGSVWFGRGQEIHVVLLTDLCNNFKKNSNFSFV